MRAPWRKRSARSTTLSSELAICGLLTASSLGQPAEIPRLLTVLRQDSWESWQVPEEARRELARHGAAAVEPLCDALAAHPSRRFLNWASAALYGIVYEARGKAGGGAPVAAALSVVLADGRRPARVRALAAELLGRLGRADAADVLVGALSDRAVCASAAQALGDIKAKSAAPALQRVAEAHAERDTRLAGIDALGSIGDESSVELLSRLSQTKDRQIRRASIDALAGIPSDAAMAALRALTEQPDAATARRAAVAMLRRGNALVQAGNIKALLAAGDQACQGCHARVFADYERSAHRREKKMKCGFCHGESVKHMEDYGKTKPDRLTTRDRMPKVCGTCHFTFQTFRDARYDPLTGLDHRFRWSSSKRTRDVMAQLQDEEPPPGMDWLFEETFESASLASWLAYPKSVWRVAEDQGSQALQLARPFRGGSIGGPATVAVARDYEVTDFVLTAKGRCTIRRGDIDLIFGWRDPKHFYFVHYAPHTSPGFNMIAVVDGRPRKPIHREKRPPARLKDQEYHVLRVERYADSGIIKAYIDDLDTPAFTAVDKTFVSGLVGVGSFGDAGFFDDVRLYGKLANRRTIDLGKVSVPKAAPKPHKPKKPAKKRQADLTSPRSLPLLLSDGFETGRASRWRPRPGNVWRLAKHGADYAYELARPGKQGKIRAPGGMSILDAPAVTDCRMTVKARCLRQASFAGRDVCLFLGYQDPSHFYYVHFSNRTDGVHNAILKVDGADRTPITIEKARPARLDDQEWRELKIERDVESGAIRAYVDDMKTPVMTAKDTTFRWGLVGVGSFDDWAVFDDVKLFGKAYTGPKKAVAPAR